MYSRDVSKRSIRGSNLFYTSLCIQKTFQKGERDLGSRLFLTFLCMKNMYNRHVKKRSVRGSRLLYVSLYWKDVSKWWYIGDIREVRSTSGSHARMNLVQVVSSHIYTYLLYVSCHLKVTIHEWIACAQDSSASRLFYTCLFVYINLSLVSFHIRIGLFCQKTQKRCDPQVDCMCMILAQVVSFDIRTSLLYVSFHVHKGLHSYTYVSFVKNVKGLRSMSGSHARLALAQVVSFIPLFSYTYVSFRRFFIRIFSYAYRSPLMYKSRCDARVDCMRESCTHKHVHMYVGHA